ncbi:hypothetical protein [Haloarcula amylovorans]|uniref:hypothetical protein n=1 Tax=Haloarcula amylovorans TaxID=2562280 RepID=UPI001076AA1E|nr:hypothetical protein [Halomicroarcula amylolytica]
MVLVTSMAAPFYGIDNPSMGLASGASSDLFDDFEDGSADGWESGTITNRSLDGVYSLAGTDTSGNWNAGPNISSQDGKINSLIYYGNPGTTQTQIGVSGSNGAYNWVKFATTGNVVLETRENSSVSKSSSVVDSVSDNTYYRFTLNYTGSEIKFKLWEAGAEEPTSYTGTLQSDAPDATSKLYYRADSDFYLDKVGANGGYGSGGVHDLSGSFEHEFTLVDQTAGDRFSDDPILRVERPDGSVTTTTFNYDEKAYVRLQDLETYNVTVLSQDGAVYEYVGFKAIEAIPESQLIIGSDTTDSTGTSTPTLEERLDVRFEEFESSHNSSGTTVTVESPEPVEEFDYQIVDENGTVLYNGTNEFDEPVTFYQGQLSDNATSNASEIDDPTMEYSGTFENGTSFNGTTELSFSDSGGIFGPTGSTGGGGASSTGGLVLLAGGAAVAAYRYRKPLINAASSAAGRLTG